MTNIFYTSDLHIGHEKVALTRGYGCASDHDFALMEVWNHVVSPGDTVYVLGDVAISGFDYALEFIKALPGKKRLITGNHDPVHPMHRRTFAPKMPAWLEAFETIAPFMRRRLEGKEFLLSHFPYADWGDGPARPGTRFEQYRLPDLGTPLLHGHTHGQERDHGHSLHVGLDAWGQPVAQDQVMAWLRTL